MHNRNRARVFYLVMALGLMFFVGSANAQERAQEKPAQTGKAEPGNKAKNEVQAPAVVNAEYGVRIARPDGWLIGKAPRGAVALFRAAGDSSSQIEVRVSPNVSVEQSDLFFVSFHNNLRKAGFVEIRGRESATYGKLAGEETEYETLANGEAFHLILWQFHRANQAWIITGFFPRARRDTHKQALEEVIGGMEFK